MRLLGLIELAALALEDARPYVGPTEVHASAASSHAEAADPSTKPSDVRAHLVDADAGRARRAHADRPG